MAAIAFRLEYTVRDLRVPPDVEYPFDYAGPPAVRVVLRCPSAEEQSRGHDKFNAFCTASSEREPNERVAEVLAQIAANKVMDPAEDDLDIALAYPGLDGSMIRVPTLSRLPDYFLSFLQQAHSELSEAAVRTISILRWRTNQIGVHNPFSWRGCYWSYDRIFWHPAPLPTGVRGVEALHLLHLSPALIREISQIAGGGEAGPLYHDLFREAWQQRNSNPRSAIVIGVAAAELAMKRLVSSLVPQAEWLVMHLPTPPLLKMIKEYLPQLPVRSTISGTAKPPPKPVLDALLKGVTLRNELAHAGGQGPASRTVEEILRAVHDLLWLLDYYSGHEWALDHLRPEARSALQSA
jgi:hypothetical protein